MNILSLINGAIGSEKGTVKLDRVTAELLSEKLGSIASGIETAVKQLEGPILEAEPVWTGQAAESFYKDVRSLLEDTRKIAEKVSENRQKLISAAGLLISASSNVRSDVDKLSDEQLFTKI